MNHVTTITIDHSGAFWAKSADGTPIAMARFDFPPRAEDGVEIMRQRAEWIARFPGARVTHERSPRRSS